MRPVAIIAAALVVAPLLSLPACQIVSGADDIAFTGAGGSDASGVGGMTGTGGSTGEGGSAPVAECELSSDCPGVESDCLTRTCEDGVCGTQAVAANTACDDDGGQWCNGQGACVQCFGDGECNEPVEKCAIDEGQCVSAGGADAMLNGDETGIDCGGSCLPCPVDQGCEQAADCTSGFCDTNAGGGGGATTGQCKACGGNQDCSGNTWCDPTIDDGTCVPLRVQGDVCDDSGECASGHCVDGTCCEEACDGTCEACSTNRTGQPNGECRAIPDGQDPDSECILLTPVCNGNRGCGR